MIATAIVAITNYNGMFLYYLAAFMLYTHVAASQIEKGYINNYEERIIIRQAQKLAFGSVIVVVSMYLISIMVKLLMKL